VRPDARSVALRTLARIDTEGAYANLALRHELDRGGLTPRDRAFTTELVYGTTRMRRRLDHVIDRFLLRAIDPPVRAALRLGAYQLHELGTPPHAAVSATVEAVTDRRVRGFVNAVLRKVAGAPVARDAWPSEAVRLSYPDWIVERLTADLGPAPAAAALEAMNEAASATERDDGYTQDLASQWVAELVGARPGERVADLCAAPGGKATLLAQRSPAIIAAGDVNPSRAALVAGNAHRLHRGEVGVFVGDGRRPPLRTEAFEHVLLDAPCSGLGVLRRRPDARWRIRPSDVEELVALQRQLLEAAIGLLAPGGTLLYSVCTLTVDETEHLDRWLSVSHPALVAEAPPGEPWESVGRGARLLPQALGTDGMYVLKLRRIPR
jgi:16S rRNA (cytosine967-C5)-methyltransferase